MASAMAYRAAHTHDFPVAHDWPLCPESHLVQFAGPPKDTHSHSLGNAVSHVSRAEPDVSSESGLFVWPPTEPSHKASPPLRPIESTLSSTDASDELYGPDRLFGPLLVPSSSTRGPRQNAESLIVSSNVGRDTAVPPIMAVLFSSSGGDTNTALANSLGQRLKDSLARDANNVTPGVDDTPYLLYALDALTARLPTPLAAANDDSRNSSTFSHPFPHTPDEAQDNFASQLTPKPACGASIDTLLTSPPLPSRSQALCSQAYSEQSPASTSPSPSTLVYAMPRPPLPSLSPRQPRTIQTYIKPGFICGQAQPNFPRLDFKPTILRPTSLVIFIFLCLLLDAGLIFSAVYSRVNDGLTVYKGSVYGGQYFVFRILPQLVAATAFLYGHTISMAVVRICPFIGMTTAGRPVNSNRSGPIFDILYPHSLLWPPVLGAGTCFIWAPLLGFWLMNFAVPLQSAVFSVVVVNGQMRWAVVQGVSWVLAGLYSSVVATTFVLLFYFHDCLTGLLSDPRSIADYIVLACGSDTLADYHGTELLGTRDEIHDALCQRGPDRLGYWSWDGSYGKRIRHGIGLRLVDSIWHKKPQHSRRAGSEGGPGTPRQKEVRRTSGDVALEDMALSPHAESVRYRYLPWCMRSCQLLCFIAASFSLLVALFVVSFLPSTNIRAGFLPGVVTTPTSGAFSAANFFYSFFPALLGQIIFLLFASIELSLRVLQPWAELAKHAGGALPEKSILADYPACLPLQSTLHAALNRHWRVAALSLMSALLAFLPALAGGLFLTSEAIVRGSTVRMMPNMVLYAISLALLVLYVACLVAILPCRNDFRLPHGVTSIAEILSFCANDDLANEPVFRRAQSRTALKTQLGINGRPGSRSRWIFATGTTSGDRRLGIHRVRQYTELTSRPSCRRPLQMGSRLVR